MKKIFTVLVTMVIGMLFSANVFAQSPEKMSYQAVVRNSNDVLVASTSIGMQISILQSSLSGTPVYTERHFPTTNANGLVSIEIGYGTVVSGSFSTINWANGSYFIKTETDLNGGANYTITGISQLLSVPYAFHAKTAETVVGGMSETDPVFNAWDKSAGISITTKQIDDFGTYIEKESDPVFSKSVASGITESDTAKWNHKMDSITEIDPLFSSSVASSITANDTAKWNRKLDEYIEVQTLSDVIANNNMANGQIKNLLAPTHDNDAVNKAYVDEIMLRLDKLELNIILNNGFFDERDGNHYNVVKIGNQIWMAENLRYLPHINSSQAISWGRASYFVYDFQGNDVIGDGGVDAAKLTSNYQTYGVLYNWAAAMRGNSSSNSNPSGVQGVCPAGWHLPSSSEWSELFDYLNGRNVAGGKMKETGTTHWNSPNTGATNLSGFSALPGGMLNHDKTFHDKGNVGFWWSATANENIPNSAYYIHLLNSVENSVIMSYTTYSAVSIRCIKD